ncbi:DUF883 family protein [Desulfovibrio sp. DV]|uniref:DUF883 family protein n=1 Tax=Desulfovibrio sp. DV TaxID=1844708 RepID=UPI00094BAEBD|nr:DUF883 family protein [Desulfovibrio sp. DV]
MAYIRDTSRAMRLEIQHLMDQAQALVDATAGEQAGRVKAARDALGGSLESAKTAFGRVEDRFMDKIQAADAGIHEKPYYAIAGAWLGGLLLGWLLARK